MSENKQKNNSAVEFEPLIKLVLIVVSISNILTPFIANYLADNEFKPFLLNEVFGLMIVVFIVSFIFWLFQVAFKSILLFWVVPFAVLLSFFGLLFVTKPVECTYNENIPKLSYTETRLERGWPFSEDGCNKELPSHMFSFGVNAIYFSSVLVSVSEVAKRFRKKRGSRE